MRRWQRANRQIGVAPKPPIAIEGTIRHLAVKFERLECQCENFLITYVTRRDDRALLVWY